MCARARNAACARIKCDAATATRGAGGFASDAAMGSCRRRHTKGRGAPRGWLRWSHRRPEATPVARQRREWSGLVQGLPVGSGKTGAAQCRFEAVASRCSAVPSSCGGVGVRALARQSSVGRRCPSPLSLLAPAFLCFSPLFWARLAAAEGENSPGWLGFRASGRTGLYRRRREVACAPRRHGR